MPMHWTAASIAQLPPHVQRQALAALSKTERDQLAWTWAFTARPEQLIPAGDWTYWLVLAGRGFGKTRTGAETVRQWIKDGRRYVNLIGATAADARDVMVEGESGILAVCPKWERPEYKPSQRKLVWPTGAESLIFSADEPDRLRGPQHDALYCDEIAAWRYAESWQQAQMGLRLGHQPRVVITTTPRPTKLIRELIADPATHVTRGKTYDNRAHLAPSFFDAVLRRYEGTRLGRQEIDGEVLDDNPGALFRRDDIDKARVLRAPDLQRIVVAIDPAATSSEGADDTGIVAAGVALVDGVQHGYILHDLTCHDTPMGWAKRSVAAYADLKADRIIGEANNGGDMIEDLIRTVDASVSYRKVTATRGKQVRAEPIASLYEQGRIHHVGSLPKLEDEMCEWDPLDATARSPNRLDAMVWALTELMLNGPNTALIDYLKAHQGAQLQATTHGATSWRD
jgi:phage terminase large subunit-like protein